MGSKIFTVYKWFMILCLAGGVVDLVVLAVMYFQGNAVTNAVMRAMWLGVLAVMLATSSLVKMRQLARFVKKPE